MGIGRVVLAWAAFAAFHSLTVSEAYERLARRVMGGAAFAAWHRLLFTAFSCAALAGVALYVRSLPDGPLYAVRGPARWLLHALQAAGGALLLGTPWDVLEFVGIRQVMRRRGSSPADGGSRLHTEKAYALVRHPLYAGISMILLAHPVQTRNSLASAAAVVLYFYIGTFLEERRMVRTFGDAYRAYRREVPRFFPLRTLRKVIVGKRHGVD